MLPSMPRLDRYPKAVCKPPLPFFIIFFSSSSTCQRCHTTFPSSLLATEQSWLWKHVQTPGCWQRGALARARCVQLSDSKGEASAARPARVTVTLLGYRGHASGRPRLGLAALPPPASPLALAGVLAEPDSCFCWGFVC